ncbi:nickel pincer cofactor biosynthesis protein LarC [Desulfotomaculum defluvii]
MVFIQIIYFDCISGFTEDMLLAALLQIDNKISLEKQLNCLGLGACTIQSHLEGEAFTTNRIFIQHCQQPQELTLFEIVDMIEETSLMNHLKEKAINIFTSLAEAKSKIFAMPLIEVRIEDALDKLLKTIGALTCIQKISPKKILISPISFKTGLTKNLDALSPIPLPESLELLKGLPISTGKNFTGIVSPLGAAIAKTIVTDIAAEPELVLSSIGYGGDVHRENLLRVIVGRGSNYLQDHLAVLETNIDDMNPEFHPFVLEKLLAEGALDVFYTPIVMKKGRAGVKLTAICRPESVDSLTGIILHETSSLGVRVSYQNRKKLFREIKEVDTCYGSVKVKLARLDVGQPVLNLKPEYEDCRSLANRMNIPVKEVYQAALHRGREKYMGSS